MKVTSLKNRLGQRGILHHIIPILAFVVLFGAVGGYFIFKSDAATSNYWIENKLISDTCLNDSSGKAVLGYCSTSASDVTLKTSGISTVVKHGSSCLEINSSGLGIFTTCNGSIGSQYLWLNYPRIEYSNVSGASIYLGASGIGAQVKMYNSNVAEYNEWKQATAPSTTTTPPPATSYCFDYEYSTANESSSITCVKDIQYMLNAITAKKYYGAATLTVGGVKSKYTPGSLSVDGQYGPLTKNQVVLFQHYEGIGVDGITGPQTWKSICTFVHNKGLSPAGNAFNNATCSKDD